MAVKFTESFRKGNIFTKLSILIPGLGNLVGKQIIKGIMYIAIEAAFVCQFTEANTANSIFFQYRVGSAANSATCISSCRELRRSLLLNFHRFFSHLCPSLI